VIRFVVLLLLIAALAAGVLLLSRGGAAEQPIEFEITTLPPGQTVIDEGEITVRTGSLIYNLTGRSRTKETVTIKARLGEGSTDGTTVSLSSADPIRPTDSQTMRLSIGLPSRLGPFLAKIELFADELPDWTFTYEVKGTKVDKLLRGKYLRMVPSGIDLGPARVGEKKSFTFELVNFGDQPITIDGIEPRDAKAVTMLQSVAGLILGPGERKRVAGEARITVQGKQFGSRIDVQSDADNGKVLIVNLSATVRPDYDISPAALPIRTAYVTQKNEYTLKVRAAEGVAPFVVADVNGLDPLFELRQPLSTEAATEQSIALRIRKDAPSGSELLRGALRISIEPALVTLKWPYALRLLPPVNAQPANLDFGTVSRDSLDKALERQVQIVALGDRKFEVTGARSQQGHVHVRVAKHMTGTPWQIVVALPALADKGVYRDQVIVETSDPDVPKILIPVRAVVR